MITPEAQAAFIAERARINRRGLRIEAIARWTGIAWLNDRLRKPTKRQQIARLFEIDDHLHRELCELKGRREVTIHSMPVTVDPEVMRQVMGHVNEGWTLR